MDRGQFFSIDFISASVIFIMSFVLLLTLLDTSGSQLAETSNFQEMHAIALFLSDSLVKTPGNPENWNASTVKSVGFADEHQVLNEAKLLSFFNMLYPDAAVATGLTGNHFNISMLDRDKQVISRGGVVFSQGAVPRNHNDLVVINRVAVMRASPRSIPVIVRVMVWQ